MKIQPFVSLDIESTGLDVQNDKVLQIGMVYDDGVTPINKLKSISFFIDPIYEEYRGYLDCEALEMNAWIIKNISQKEDSKYPVYQPSEARKVFYNELRTFYYHVLNKDNHWTDKEKKKIQFAGKNLQGFDIPILKSNCFLTRETQKYVGYRMLDVGPLFYLDFGYVPCLGEINKLVQGHSTVTHDALHDAYDVVRAVRYKLGVE